MKFFVCKHCGNFVAMIHDAGVPMVCCGENMTEVVANSVDAAQEKHVPVVDCAPGNKLIVKVGSVAHPMTEAHSIEWIYVETEKGGQRRILAPGEKPEATFVIDEDNQAVAVYAYCNLHGLWVTKLGEC